MVYLNKSLASLEEETSIIKNAENDQLKEYEQKLYRQEQEAKETLSKQEEQSREEIVALNKQIAQLKENIEGQAGKLKLEIKEKESTVNFLKKEKTRLSGDLGQRDKENSQLQVTVAKLKEDISTKDELWQKKLDSAIEKTGRHEELIKLTNDLKAKDSRINLLEKENDTFKNYLNQRDDELAELKETVSKLKEELTRAAAPVNVDDKPSSQKKMWYSEKEEFEQYYYVIREKIFDKLKKVDFSEYRGKVSSVRVEFELYPSGILKSDPKFYGTRDRELKSVLYRSFQQALPFPAFPKSLNKSSQRFIIAISFE
ncbi:hypothetical protein ACFL2Y_04480 [Candidatus Omnitrophota bacterium]